MQYDMNESCSLLTTHLFKMLIMLFGKQWCWCLRLLTTIQLTH